MDEQRDIKELEERILGNLTPLQREPASDWDSDIEIVACAGAGKTKTITHRIINMIAHGVAPENIVAITFTEKAAAEMKGRIYKIGKELLGNTTGFAGMYIGTIDAWCLKMLQDRKDEYAKFTVLDEVQTRIFLERYEKKEESGFKGSVVDNAYNLNHTYDRASRKSYPGEKYSQKLNIYSGFMSILNSCWYDKSYRKKWDSQTMQCLAAYNKCLRDQKFFDFSGLLREMIENLDPDSDTNGGEMSDFARDVFSQVKYMTIDEYQDTNPSQEYMVSLFKKYAGTKLCVVGDADQTIYQFRGSDESNILGFADKFGSKKYHLNENFRSTAAVIDIAEKFISQTHKGEPDYVPMVPQNLIKDRALAYEDGDTVYKGFANYDEETDFIIERVKELHSAGVPYKEMVVLFRKRYEKDFGDVVEDFQNTMAVKFQAAGIPYYVEGLNVLFLTKEYKACYGIFSYLYEKFGKAYKQENGQWLNGYVSLPGEHKDTEKAARESLKSLWRDIDSPPAEAGLERAVSKLASLDLRGKNYGNDFNMQQVYQDFIGELSVMASDDPVSERIIYNLGKFSKLIADYELLYFREKPVFKLIRFRRHVEKVVEGLYPEGMDDNNYCRSDAVYFMTIHQSKGLEFTAVFIPTLVENVFPGIPFSSDGKIYGPADAIKKPDWIPNYQGYKGGVDAESKIFYVAVTRAKKYLFLTYAKNYGIEEVESQFIRAVKASSYIKEFSGDIRYGSEHLPEIEDVPIPVVLNFSLLSNYFDCPYRFKISNLYGFVQPYTSAQGFGRMLHEIMMHIHRAWIDGKDLEDSQVEEIAENALYLPFASKPQLENSLNDAKNCAKAYVEQNKKDARRIKAAEMDINIEMGEGVSVNGRIDLVRTIDTINGSEKTAIVDLKSAGKDAEQCLNAEQLKIYAIGYQEASGEPADYLMIYNLDKPDGSGNKGEDVRNDDLIETRKRIIKAARSIRNSELPCQKGEKCKSCYVKGLCKL